VGRCGIGQATRLGCDYLPCVREVLRPAAGRCCLAAGWAEWTRRNVEEVMHTSEWRVEIHEPTGAWKSWFAGPNLGSPFDRQMESAVLSDINGGK